MVDHTLHLRFYYSSRVRLGRGRNDQCPLVASAHMRNGSYPGVMQAFSAGVFFARSMCKVAVHWARGEPYTKYMYQFLELLGIERERVLLRRQVGIDQMSILQLLVGVKRISLTLQRSGSPILL